MKNTEVLGSMKAKILLRFGLIALVLLFVGGLFWVSAERIKAVQSRVSSFADDKMLLQKAVADHYQWAAQLNSAINYGTDFSGSTDPKTCSFGKAFYSDKVQNNPEWAVFIQKVEPLHNKIHESAREILMQTDVQQAKELYLNEIRPALDGLVKEFNSHIVVQDGKLTEAQREENQAVQLQMAAIVAQLVVLLSLFVNFYFFFRREIIHPVSQIETECGRLAQGQLALDFTVNCKNSDLRRLGDSLGSSIAQIKKYIDDIDRAMGEMSNRNFNVIPSEPFIGDFKAIEDSISRMILSMTDALSQMGVAADQVSSGSDQVSYGAQALATGATEQAGSVQELAAAVADLSRQVGQNAENSDRASEMANGATDAIAASNQQMQQLMTSMHEIDARSKEIGKIIKAIEDIAVQTNLLSLNAAVEAARAGSAGKGFAVVADEVRNLAAKSAEAAQSTTSLIEGSIASIDNGVRLARATADKLLGVVDGARDTTAVIVEITKATNEQAEAIALLTNGLDQISAVVQTNSATSEESAAASEELSSQATLLKQIIGSFQLLERGPKGPQSSREYPADDWMRSGEKY